MTPDELRVERRYRYQERLGIMEVWGHPTAWQHNTAVEEADEAIRKLKGNDGIVEKLRQLRESL